jgi:hypothetical protein
MLFLKQIKEKRTSRNFTLFGNTSLVLKVPKLYVRDLLYLQERSFYRFYRENHFFLWLVNTIFAHQALERKEEIQFL